MEPLRNGRGPVRGRSPVGMDVRAGDASLWPAAVRSIVVQKFPFLNPVLAGLGMFWFLRSEGAGRVSATTGGRSGRWSRRLLWLLLAAGAWGQVVAAMPSHGAIVGTGALGVYLISALPGRRKAMG